MAFDLRRALLAKEERDSSRLMEFDFRLRARTLSLLAGKIGRDPVELAQRITAGNDDAIIEALQAELPDLAIAELFARSREEARRQLMAQLGDPSPTAGPEAAISLSRNL